MRTFKKQQVYFRFFTPVKEEIRSENEDDCFEPKVIIKSRAGRIIKQNPNLYKEEEDNENKNPSKTKFEPKIEIISPRKHKVEKRSTKKHKKRAEPKPIIHRCCMCQNIFTTLTELTSHMDSTHVSTIQKHEAEKYTSKHIHECKYCKQKFRLARSLEEHFNVANYKEPPRDRTTEYVNRKKNVDKVKVRQESVCTFCGKTYSTKNLMKEHELRSHALHLPIICPHPGCERRFASKTFMNKHFKIHGEKKHVCDVS